MPVIPAIPAPFNNPAIQVVLGKERTFQFQVTNRALATPAMPLGPPFDVTTWTNFRFLAKVNAGDLDNAAIISKSLGAGIVLVTPTQGLLQVFLVPTDTSSLADIRQSFYAEIQGTDGALVPWSLWQGGLDVLPSAIKASN